MCYWFAAMIVDLAKTVFSTGRNSHPRNAGLFKGFEFVPENQKWQEQVNRLRMDYNKDKDETLDPVSARE